MGLFNLIATLAVVSGAVAAAAVDLDPLPGQGPTPKRGVVALKENIEKKPFFPYAKCYDHLSPDHFNTTGRNGIVPEAFRWPWGIIPFVIEDSINQDNLNAIYGGMKLIQEATCLRFVKRTGEPNYITIGNKGKDSGCYCSGIGMRGGPQTVNLEYPGCTYASTAAHEFLHAAGLWHEQSRDDRDDYNTIMWENIQKENWSQYNKCNEQGWPNNDGCSAYDQAYNVRSIMHYPGYGGFEIDSNKPVMVSKDPNNPIPRSVLDNNKLTSQDIAKISIMYSKCQ